MRLLWSISRWVEDILCISPLIKEEERTGRGFSGFTDNLPNLEPMSSLINFLTQPPPVTCVQCFTTIFVTTKGIAFIGFSPTSFMFLPHHQSYGWQAVEWIYWLACWFFRWLLGCVTAFVWLPLLSSGLKKKNLLLTFYQGDQLAAELAEFFQLLSALTLPAESLNWAFGISSSACVMKSTV